ncbi:hypothetical protein [Pectobacterium brasiliense]|uniref:hypothetical protein n=1 Tax=Pectobacterium brasiliense TaxID=180957 RepID=UPI0025A234E4|nr:hypothetical protein [Pectobacterium brasiliense]WJM81176.1 hypothetical protein QTI90_23865 [Pectobacterium brasiliense]
MNPPPKARCNLTEANSCCDCRKGIIDPLVAQGLLQLGPSLRRGRGQPSVQLSLVPGYAFSVGVSVMVDGIAVVLIDFAGQVRGMRQLTAFPLTLDLLAARLPELLEQLLVAPELRPL